MVRIARVARSRAVIHSFGIGKPVDIGEMAVLEPDLLRLLVHQIDKGLVAAGKPFGEDDAGVVARLDDGAMQQIVDR